MSFALQNAATDAENLLLSLTQQCAKIGDLEESLATNLQRKEALEIELRSVKVEKSEVSRDLEDESNSAMHLKVEVEEEEVLLKADLDDMRSARDHFKSLRDSVMETQSKLATLNTVKIAADIDAATMRIDTGTAKIHELSIRKEALTNELREQERTKKTVRDNLDYRASIAKRDALLRKLADTKRKLGLVEEGENEKGGDEMDQEGKEGGGETARQKEQAAERAIQKAEQTKGRLIQELYMSKGKVETFREQVRALVDKLAAPNLVDIEKTYRKAFIQHETVELAVKDLETYHKALDKALQVHTLHLHSGIDVDIDIFILSAADDDDDNEW